MEVKGSYRRKQKRKLCTLCRTIALNKEKVKGVVLSILTSTLTPMSEAN